MTIHQKGIPIFPEFRPAQIKDREYLQTYLNNYLPYSDFNYLNMFMYKTEFSFLNGNLAVKMNDYLTDDPFVSFIGTNRINHTVETLLNYAANEKISEELKLVPGLSELRVLKSNSHIRLEKDVKNFDYILSCMELAEMKGKKYYDKRNLSNRFKKNHTTYSLLYCDLAQEKIQQQILELFEEWRIQTARKRSETKQQLVGLQRLLQNSRHFNLLPLAIAIDDKLVACSITEIVSKDYVIMHIEKALNKHYPGVLSVLKQEVSQRLLVRGCTKINYTQDLALPGLQQAKKLWRPIDYLEKLTIRASE